MKLIIVSGRSGSGKSISLHLLEDSGYYCIDNLPATLLLTLIEHIQDSYQKIAIGIDARNLPHDLDHFHQTILDVKKAGHDCQILYLDADNNTLFKRFSETRRKHPLTDTDTSLQEAIEQEKELLQPIAHLADFRLETSHLTLHQLRQTINNRICHTQNNFSLLLQSFGYKYGIPQDSDYIFDVRFLPNPYWQTELRQYTGLDKEIKNFLMQHTETTQHLNVLKDFLLNWIPLFIASNRSYMTISIGCTGGQHRSVFIANALAKLLKKNGQSSQLRHRELI